MATILVAVITWKSSVEQNIGTSQILMSLFSATQVLFSSFLEESQNMKLCSCTSKDTSNTWKTAGIVNNQKREYQVYPSTVTSRLASFRPLLFIERPDSLFFSLLSSSGFYYTGNGTTVECQSCSNLFELIHFKSSPGSQAYHIPGCQFIEHVSNEANNLLSNDSQMNEQSAVLNSRPTNSLDENPRDSISLQSDQQQTQPRDSEIRNTSSGESVKLTTSVYPVFNSIEKRLVSFTQQWPAGHIHTPSELARTGFFYAGYSDCVRCFHCGLGLRSWRPGDDINFQHERFRPTCQFLLTLLRTESQNQRERQNTQNRFPATVNVINGITSSSATTSTQEAAEVSESSDVSGFIPSNEENTDAPEAIPNQDNDSTLSLITNLLQRENQSLKELMQCKSCKMSPVQDVFLPCGEMYTCRDCSIKFTHCPSCGKRILGTVNVFFA